MNINQSERTVFVVDDERSVQESLRMILKDSYHVAVYNCPEDALKDVTGDVDLIFTDIRMLSMSGLEFLERVKDNNPEIEVVVITAYPDFDSSVKALRLGAFDYIVKPFGKAEVLNAAKRALSRRRDSLKRARMVEELQEAIHLNYEQTTRALVAAVDAKDSYTAAHSRRTSSLLVMLGKRIGIDAKQLTDYKRVSELHDIGKIGVAGHILRKVDPLTPREFAQIKAHPLMGYRILSPASFLEDGLDIVLRHHESYDGSGYPDGLKGEEIPFSARLFAIIDAYDAMTTERCYRRKLTSNQAIEEIARAKTSQFDPSLVELVLPHLKRLEHQGMLKSL